MRFRMLLLFVVSMSFGISANITVSYTGQIQFSNVPGVAVGTPFTGNFTYSTSDPVLGVGSNYIVYSLNDPSDSLFLSVAGFQFFVSASPNLGMIVKNGPVNISIPGDYLQVSQNSSSGTGNFSTNYPGLQFDQSGTQFVGGLSFLKSNAIPNPFNTAGLILGSQQVSTSASIFLVDGSLNVFSFTGLISNVQASTDTPETPTGVLVSMGIALLIAWLLTRARRLDAVAPQHKELS